MDEKQLYVFFENRNYKLNKAELLKCKASLIQLQRNFNHLSALRARKRRLLNELEIKVTESLTAINILGEKMPNETLPKSVREKLTPKKIKESDSKDKKEKTPKEDYFQVDSESLDREFIELNKKIKELSG